MGVHMHHGGGGKAYSLSYKLQTATDSLTAFLPFMKNLGLMDSGIIYNSLSDLFGSSGILPLFSADNNAI